MSTPVNKFTVSPKGDEKRLNSIGIASKEQKKKQVAGDVAFALGATLNLDASKNHDSIADNPLAGVAPAAGASQGTPDVKKLMTLFEAIGLFGTLYDSGLKSTIFMLDESQAFNKQISSMQTRVLAYQAIQQEIQSNISKAQTPFWMKLSEQILGVVMGAVTGFLFGGPGGMVAGITVGLGMALASDITKDKDGHLSFMGRGENGWDQMFDAMGLKSPAARAAFKAFIVVAASVLAGAGAAGLNSAFIKATEEAAVVTALAGVTRRAAVTGVNTGVNLAGGIRTKDFPSDQGAPEGVSVNLWGDIGKGVGFKDKNVGYWEMGVGVTVQIASLLGSYAATSGLTSAAGTNQNVMKILRALQTVGTVATGIDQGVNAYLSGVTAYYSKKLGNARKQLLLLQGEVAITKDLSETANNAVGNSIKSQQTTMEAWKMAITSFRTAVLQAA